MTRDARWDLVVVCVLTLPFLLNDLANIYVSDYRLWLATDYGFVKALPLAVMGYLRGRGVISFRDLGLTAIPLRPLVAWTAGMTVIGVALDSGVGRFLAMMLPDPRLGGMPPITNPFVEQVDLYVGLAFVAFVEEIIFRGLYFAILRKYLGTTASVFALSSLVFGLIHWSLGLNAVLHTAVIGAVFMICLCRTGSVWPTVIAHFLVNYVAFSGVFAG